MDEVVSVTLGLAGGVTVAGLTRQVGGLMVCTGVTSHCASDTEPLNPFRGLTAMVALEEPPGTTDEGWNCWMTCIVKSCAPAEGTAMRAMTTSKVTARTRTE